MYWSIIHYYGVNRVAEVEFLFILLRYVHVQAVRCISWINSKFPIKLLFLNWTGLWKVLYDYDLMFWRYDTFPSLRTAQPVCWGEFQDQFPWACFQVNRVRIQWMPEYFGFWYLAKTSLVQLPWGFTMWASPWEYLIVLMLCR